jgi:hypothetical protein
LHVVKWRFIGGVGKVIERLLLIVKDSRIEENESNQHYIPSSFENVAQFEVESYLHPCASTQDRV